MSNVIDLHGPKEKTPEPAKDFKIALDVPLDLGLPEPPRKKPSVTKRIKWKLSRIKQAISDKAINPVRYYLHRREGNRLLGELVHLTRKLNRDDFHIFVSTSGHVNRVMVYVYPGGWKKGGERVIVFDNKLPGYGEYTKTKPGDLRETMKLMKSLSKLNHLKR